MPLGQFLFEYLYRRGVRHGFGVPGDFALPTFTWLEKSKIQSITMPHETAAGFAADAYSRINGIGFVCVTYCLGGLNVLNGIAGAYAEKLPVFFRCISMSAAASLLISATRSLASTIASTIGEFDAALSRAQKSDRVHVIELKIPRDDVSQQLARIAAEVRKMRGSKNS